MADDKETAEEIAGKLLGHHVCFDCHKYFPKEEMEDHSGNIKVIFCKECGKKYHFGVQPDKPWPRE